MEPQGAEVGVRPPIVEQLAVAEARNRRQGPLARKETQLETGVRVVAEETSVKWPAQITREARVDESGKTTEVSVGRRSAEWQMVSAKMREDGTTEITLDNEEMFMRFGEAEYSYGNQNVPNPDNPVAPGSIKDSHAVRLIYNAAGKLTEVRLRGSFPNAGEEASRENVGWQVLRLRPNEDGYMEAVVESWQAQDEAVSEEQRAAGGTETLLSEGNPASLTEPISLGDERISIIPTAGQESRGTRYQVSWESEQGESVWAAEFPDQLADLQAIQESAREMAPVPAVDNINHALDLLVGKDNMSGQIQVY